MSIRTGITRGVLGVPGGVFAFLLQRSVDFTTFVPVPAIRHVFGFDEVEFPIANVNTMIEYDFGVPDNPRPTYPPPKATDTHGLLRKLVWSQDQMWHFLMTGETITS